MEFMFFLFVVFVIFSAVKGDKKNSKTPRATRTLQGGGRDDRNSDDNGADDYPTSWSNYERAESGEGMQDDLDPSALYKISKQRVETARKAAAAKLSYQGLPKARAKRPKNKGRTIVDTNPFLSDRPPLVRDMNMQRRNFLSGGNHNTFGEREKKRGTGKILFLVIGLGVLGLYFALRTGSEF